MKTVPARTARSRPVSSMRRHRAAAQLTVGALGVVFGDIGTSPLYALKALFALGNHAIEPSPDDVYGLISMIFWAITIVVSVKYVALVLRADNDGEGGVMALAALVRKATRGRSRLLPIALVLGAVGAGLFYGDSVITPAISVLAAVEGLSVLSSGLAAIAVPVGLVILIGLFLIQRFGTHRIARLFGPVMFLWFVAIAAVAIPHIAAHPRILMALSPGYLVTFVTQHPLLAFMALGAVVLAITGAEALYADIGHFGRPPIRRAWFALVLPALVINYLGQGALIITDPRAAAEPFFLLCPHWARIPMIILATSATVIASQAVISGTFSVSRQAMRLGFLPTLSVHHTSSREPGQIYLPAVNGLLLVGVVLLVLIFPSSAQLATAYGLAVTGTFLVTTCLLLMVASAVWQWPAAAVVPMGVVLLSVEGVLLAGNLVKVHNGGWIPILIATIIVTVMVVWQKGRHLVVSRRIRMERPLQEFVTAVRRDRLTRVEGAAIFPHPASRTTPIALRANADFNHVVHSHVIIVRVVVVNVPYVPPHLRVAINDLGDRHDGIVQLTMSFGFQEEQNIPLALEQFDDPRPNMQFDRDSATYFLSKFTLEEGPSRSMPRWQKRLFISLAHNAANRAEHFFLPADRTVVMGATLTL